MNTVTGGPIGSAHIVMLYDNIASAGQVQYAFLVGVFDNTTHEPVFFVASEINQLAATAGGGSHFLGAFDGAAHMNLGASNDWAEAKKFFPEALRIVEGKFGKGKSSAASD
jgi:hypothetical protein